MAEAADHRFPCEACGSDLRYAPGTDLLTCDHCGNEQAITGAGPWAGRALEEVDFRQTIANAAPSQMEETAVLDCPNCGAQVEFEPDTHAAECPFCATPVVTSTGAHRHIKPAGQLPFLLSEEAAREAMTTWLGRLWFAPNGLQAFARKGRSLQGIYVPYWTYDAETRSRYRGQRGTVYYETRRQRVVVDGKTETRQVRVQKVRWNRVSGHVARNFDDVLVLGSRALPKRYTDGLAPWDLSGLEPYQPEYLAGFRAEGYTVDLQEGYQEAQAIMERTILRDVKFDIGGDRQRVDDLKTDVGALTFKHILLPVWIAAYKYRGKSFRFVVNGRTGAVQGERPYSAWKIALAVLVAALVAGTIGYLVALEQM
ncbi:MAG: primosomal protein N' (replication factor Y) - superfamily II helicase [Pseudomonadota bacterium]